VDPRIRTAVYREEEVYRLHGFVGYGLELIFERGEQFVGQAGGDLEGIAFGAHENHVILKPRAANVGTNFVIYTNQRAYRFDYSVADRRPDPRRDAVTYAVKFIYPPSSSDARKASGERIEGDLAAARTVRRRNFDYWFCGHPAIKPIAASDDGVHTRIRFGSKTELPALFVRGDDNTESLLNFSVDQGEIVVHRVARQFIIRRGRLTGCIVNAAFAGTGERLDSGTVSPSVRRERRDLVP
jgi:type IV secretion system protein VirB9